MAYAPVIIIAQRLQRRRHYCNIQRFIFFLVLLQSPGGSPETRSSTSYYAPHTENTTPKEKKERRQKRRIDNTHPLSKILINFFFSFIPSSRRTTSPIGAGCASFLFILLYTRVRFTPTTTMTTIGPAIYCNNLQSLHIYNTRYT